MLQDLSFGGAHPKMDINTWPPGDGIGYHLGSLLESISALWEPRSACTTFPATPCLSPSTSSTFGVPFLSFPGCVARRAENGRDDVVVCVRRINPCGR